MSVNSKPLWRQREDALLVGSPLVMAVALSIAPVAISLLSFPAFPHARILGFCLLPLMGFAVRRGCSRLAFCFQSRFDVISFLAGGTLVLLIVVTMAAGIMLASAMDR